MPKKINFSYSVINITAHPHTPEIYKNLFRATCAESIKEPQKYRGEEMIELREKELDALDSGSLEFAGIAGLINKFTKINDDSWFDRERGQPVPENERPNFDNHRFFPNLSSFPFVFFPDGHRLFIVTSLPDKKLAPAYFAKALQGLMGRTSLRDISGDISATVEMDKSGIDAILRIERLEKLIIRVALPNGDDLKEHEKKMIARFNVQNVGRYNETISAQRGKSIEPDAETLALMHLAQSNGYIIADGQTNSEKVKLKSSEFPVDFKSSYFEGESIFRKLIEDAKMKIGSFVHRTHE